MAATILLRFNLKIGALPEERFHVHEFTLDEAISRCYEFEITATSKNRETTYEDLVGKRVSLTVAGEDYTVHHHGILNAFHLFPDGGADQDQELHLYKFIVQPKLATLAYTTQSRVFLNKTLPDIVGEVLSAAGMTAEEFKFEATGPFPRREFTVQYNETDLNFLERLLEEEGVWYSFQHQERFEVVVFADTLGCIRPIPHTPQVGFRPVTGLNHQGSGHVFALSMRQQMVTGKAVVKDYNDNTPEVRIQAEEDRPGQGKQSGFGLHGRSVDEAQRLARIAADRNAVQKILLEGEGIARAFRAGSRFRLDDPLDVGFPGEYTLIQVVHHGDQREGFEGDEVNLNYRNRFTCIPADVQYRPPVRPRKPKVPGIMVARIDGVESPYASLDEQGRYKVKMPFDLTDRRDGQASLPVRLSQPYSGPGYGIHFPNHIANDIVLAFVNGDIDRPVALGTLPNPSQASPVTSQNHSESVIRTASGHTLRMDDLEDHTIVDLATHGGHALALDDAAGTRGISLETTGEHVVHLDDAGKKILVRSKYGHEVLLDDGNKTLTVKTAGGQNLFMSDPAKSITLEDGQSKTRIHMDGAAGNIEITASDNVSINAGKSVSITAGDGLITQSGKATAMTVGKDYTLTVADNATQEAGKAFRLTAGKDMAFQAGEKWRAIAKEMSLEAEKNLQLKGKKIMAKAESDFQVEGSKVNVKASGDIILKGANVKQN